MLESIAGRDILPRGSGIVTRCPLIMQLRRKEGMEYAEFGHQAMRRYTDFNEVRTEIENRTAALAGGEKDIVANPI